MNFPPVYLSARTDREGRSAFSILEVASLPLLEDNTKTRLSRVPLTNSLPLPLSCRVASASTALSTHNSHFSIYSILFCPTPLPPLPPILFLPNQLPLFSLLSSPSRPVRSFLHNNLTPTNFSYFLYGVCVSSTSFFLFTLVYHYLVSSLSRHHSQIIILTTSSSDSKLIFRAFLLHT